MKTRKLYLVRHGQTGGAKYNKLTALGESQARSLGRYFARHEIRFAAGVTGTLERQRETYALFAEAFAAESGQPAPEPSIIPGLNEISPEIWFTIGEELRHSDPAFREDFKGWLESLRESEKRGISAQAYINVLTRVITAWIQGEYENTAIESFADFHARVLNARAALPPPSPNGASDNILAISSGIPISLLIGATLGLDLERSLRFARRVANTSLSVFDITDATAWEPITVNSLPHLEDPAIRTDQ
jgi:broad specificity phosphatase PhoE